MVKQRARTIFRRLQNGIINSTAVTVLLSSSMGGALPLLFTGTANALPAQVTTEVTPADTHGWLDLADDTGGSLSYVAGPSTAPIGTGSAQLEVTSSSDGRLLADLAYGGTKLSDISNLSYSTYVQSGNNTIAPSVQIDVSSDVTNTGLGYQGRLVYEPYMNGTVTDGTWQTWQADQGKWWLTKSSTLFGNQCGQANPCTFSQLVALYPNMGVIPGPYQLVGFKAGSSWTNFVGNVDNFHLITSVSNDLYNFDPAPPAAPTNLHFTQNGNTLTCGSAIKSNGTSPNTTTMAWDLPVGETSTGYKVVPTYPSGSHGTTYSSNSSATSLWVAANIGQGYGAAPNDQGLYSYSVQYKDASGLWSLPATCSLTYDTVRPTITFINPDFSNPNFSVGPNIEIQASDPGGSGIATTVLHIFYANNAQALFCPVSHSDTTSCDTSSLGEGVYYVKAGATDNAGNNQTVTQNFTIDKTKPLVNISSPADGAQINSHSFSVTGTASDALSGVDHVNYTITKISGLGGSYVSSVASGTASGTTAWSFNASSLTDGFYRLKVQAFDAAGNWKYDYHDVQVDTTRPTITFLNPDFSNPNFSVGPNIEIQASDPGGSGIATTVLHIFYANNAQALFCPVSHSDTTSCDTSSLGEGVYYVKAGATDNAGNNKTVVQYFTIDKTKPVAGTTKITSPTNGQLFSTGSFGVSGTANDSLSGIDPNKVYITINKISGLGGSFVASTAFNNEQAVYDTATHSFSYNGVSGLSDGFYRIQLKAYDKAGNIRFDHLDVQVDSTAPTVNITAPGDNDTLSFALDGVFTIRGGVNDVNPDHYYLHISGPGGYTSGPGTVNDSTSFTDQPLFNWDLSGLASGTYTIDLEARDAAGNKDAGSVQTISVTIDNTAPTLTINPSSGTDTTPTITGTTSEATDTVTVDGNTASVSATANGSGTYNWSYTPAAPFLIGSHTITVVSTDQNGNATTQTATVTVTSPVITLIGGAGGGGTTTVTVTPTTGGTDNTDGQVLGASTNNPSDSGQVKAAETSNGNGDNTVKDNFQSSNFLGLGWWWLLVLAAILGGWWFLAGRRDND